VSWWKPLVDLLPTTVNQVGEVFKRKHEVKLKKIESQARIEEAKAEGLINMLRDRQNADINWEQMSIQNSGWKDEYLTLFTTGLVAMCFIPWTQPFVKEGFTVLQDYTPFWFQTTYLVVVGSAFGVRAWKSFTEVAAKRSYAAAVAQAKLGKSAE
jgi:hypothetical protein